MNDYSKITALYSRLTNIRHYIDDDESGRFFVRSAYSRMIEDVENGKVGVCIMKDMTRWGRISKWETLWRFSDGTTCALSR